MTLDQFISRQSDRIMAADTDGDGKVSKAELAAQMKNGRGDPDRMFAMMDANHDGFIDKDEIRAVLTRRFQRMDANHDGVVTPEERMAQRQQRRAGQDDAAPQP
jgi:Ca2+-binding EF-hand superfamily protein